VAKMPRRARERARQVRFPAVDRRAFGQRNSAPGLSRSRPSYPPSRPCRASPKGPVGHLCLKGTAGQTWHAAANQKSDRPCAHCHRFFEVHHRLAAAQLDVCSNTKARHRQTTSSVSTTRVGAKLSLFFRHFETPASRESPDLCRLRVRRRAKMVEAKIVADNTPRSFPTNGAP